MKKIKCGECQHNVAYLLDEGTLEFSRQSGKHHVLIVGADYTMVSSCPYCEAKTTLTVRDGKLIEDNLLITEEKPNGQEQSGQQPSSTSGGQPTGGHDPEHGTPEDRGTGIGPSSGESNPEGGAGSIPEPQPGEERRHTVRV